MTTKSYSYETRCRRCGNISIQKAERTESHHIDSWIKEQLYHLCANPGQYDCRYCGKPTVQEVISYKIQN